MHQLYPLVGRMTIFGSLIIDPKPVVLSHPIETVAQFNRIHFLNQVSHTLHLLRYLQVFPSGMSLNLYIKLYWGQSIYLCDSTQFIHLVTIYTFNNLKKVSLPNNNNSPHLIILYPTFNTIGLSIHHMGSTNNNITIMKVPTTHFTIQFVSM